MSGRWFRFYADAMRNPKIARLSDKEFRRALADAVDGKPSPLGVHIAGPFVRPLAHEWRVIRERIFDRDDYTCIYCGERGGKLECDHIVPVARGGDHHDDNLATACKPCNRAKAAKTLEEWQS